MTIDIGNAAAGISIAVIAEQTNRCTEFVQVYNDNADIISGQPTNKAWTNRVWQNAREYRTVGNYTNFFQSMVYNLKKAIKHIPMPTPTPA